MKPLSMAALLLALVSATLVGSAQDRPATTPAPSAPNLDSITLADLKRDVFFMASEEMRGRETLRVEARLTAAYVRTRMEQAGLKPAGENGTWYQEVGLRSRQWEKPPQLSVAIGPADNRVEKKLEYITDFVSTTGPGPSTELKDVPVVFAGYAVRDDSQQYNDIAGLDMKGKLALVMRYAPSGWSREGRRSPFNRAGDMRVKERLCRDAGAVGILMVTAPLSLADTDAQRTLPSPSNAELSPPLELALGNERESTRLPFFHLTSAMVDHMLGGEGRLEKVQREFNEKNFAGRPTLEGVSVSLKMQSRATVNTCRNVLGKIEGETDEWIIIGAHHDHLGLGYFGSRDQAGNQGKVHPGADDNASGTSALLEIAEQIATSGQKPRRSLLFITFTGEEKGLLGSRWYVRHPVIPHSKAVAMINFDMIGRLETMTMTMQGAGASSFIERHCREAAAAFPALTIQIPQRGRQPVAASDHWPFYAEAGMPVLFPMGALNPVYHTTADVPETIFFEGALAATRFTAEVVWRMSQDPAQSDYSGPVRDATGPDGKPRNGGTARPTQPTPRPQPEPAPPKPPEKKEEEF